MDGMQQEATSSAIPEVISVLRRAQDLEATAIVFLFAVDHGDRRDADLIAKSYGSSRTRRLSGESSTSIRSLGFPTLTAVVAAHRAEVVIRTGEMPRLGTEDLTHRVLWFPIDVQMQPSEVLAHDSQAHEPEDRRGPARR